MLPISYHRDIYSDRGKETTVQTMQVSVHVRSTRLQAVCHLCVLLSVNNAGVGLLGPVESISIDEMKRVFETNFFGVVRMIKEVMPDMKKRRSGHIVVMSSVMGLQGRIALCFQHHGIKSLIQVQRKETCNYDFICVCRQQHCDQIV